MDEGSEEEEKLLLEEVRTLKQQNELLKLQMWEDEEGWKKAILNENILGELYWRDIIDAEGNLNELRINDSFHKQDEINE